MDVLKEFITVLQAYVPEAPRGLWLPRSKKISSSENVNLLQPENARNRPSLGRFLYNWPG